MARIKKEVASTKAAVKAVKKLGGSVKAARALGVERHQTVQSWMRVGVPARYCPRIEQLTGVTRQELRPGDWQDYWPPFLCPEPAGLIAAG